MKVKREVRLYGMFICFMMIMGLCFAQGPLVPPAGPAEIYKSLDEIEPRIPIKSLPFTIDEPGSYYLTGALSYPGATQAGITINASNVYKLWYCCLLIVHYLLSDSLLNSPSTILPTSSHLG